MSTEAKSFSTLMVALALFGLAGSAVMATIPRFFAGPARPDFTIFLAAGVAGILLTAGLFALIHRLGMGFGKTVLVLAAGYNAMIAFVKLALAPAALYQANREQSFDNSMVDPNSLWFYLGVGSAVLLLYLLVFWVMYTVFKRRRGYRARETDTLPGRRDRWLGRMFARRRRAVLVALVVATVALLASFLWVMPVVFVRLPTFSYLAYIFSTFGAAITLALILAAILAHKAFDEVEGRAVRLGDATLAGRWWLAALLQVYIAGMVVMLYRLYRVDGREDEQLSIGVGARMGNGSLVTLLGVLVLAGRGTDWITQVAFGLALAAFHALNFVDFLLHPDRAVIGYKG